MNKIIFTVGCPGSGKTTWAKDKQDTSPIGEVIRLNRDDIRENLFGNRYHISYGGKHMKQYEELVTSVQINTCNSILALNKDVTIIFDDTNADYKRLMQLMKMYNSSNCKVEIVYFTDTPLETCLERNSKRARKVPEDIIRNMYNKSLETMHELEKLSY